MSIKDRLINSSNAFVSRTKLAPMVNPFLSGQNGILPNLGRYLGNSSYVSRPCIARVVDFPRWIKYTGDEATYRRAIKSFFETQSKISGLQRGLQADFVEQDVGQGGKKQYDLSKVTQTQSTVTHEIVDKYGLPYQNLFTIWMRYGMMDPDAGIPLIVTLTDQVVDMLPDLYCVTVLYFEPDPLHKSVNKSWLITNMAPRSNGQDEGSRDLTQAGQQLNLSIEFTGLQQSNLGTDEMALEELEKMDISGINPTTRKAFLDKIDAAVASTAGGYTELLNEVASDQI